MMKVLEFSLLNCFLVAPWNSLSQKDWKKEKRDFLQSLSRISTLPRTNISESSPLGGHQGQIASLTYSPQVSSGPSSVEPLALTNRPIAEKKAAAYGEVVKNLTSARERGLPFKALMGEDSAVQHNVSKKMSLVIGARCHLEWGHEKYIMETIQAHPAQILLRDYGVLDFDAVDARRQPPVDTTWQQIYFCMRTGYYNEAREISQQSRMSHQFSPLLTEWISTGGMVSEEMAAVASEECEKIFGLGDRGEDFLWFQLSAVRESPARSSVVLNEGLAPYTLDDLQAYLNKFELSHYTNKGKDPLVYPYVLLLSIQLLPAVLYLSKDMGDEGYNVDAVHMAIVLADYGVLSEAAAATVGGGQLLWSGRGNMDQRRQRSSTLKQLLTELLSRDDGIDILLGPRGTGEEGQLGRFLTDEKTRKQFLLEAARQYQDAGLYDKSIEIQKRVRAFSAALDTINKCLSDAICALERGRLDGESRTSGLILSGNEILEMFKYYPEIRENVLAQQIVLRQLEAVLSIHKLARLGNNLDAMKEVAKLPFLPLDPRAPDFATDVFQNLSHHVQA
ncbi:Nuclear pore complex protein NUP93A [Capsicum baccatum]|uniref:Nuclear pore protein n=1 Tax=Capsicum baccatum TaxID=33114 RepID=A0A2G2X9N2_CAPBA|nr:Nuclear pore complex protein NUP93A [Capsicum baccatum]